MKQLGWTLIHPRMTFDMLGYIPGWLHEADPRPAKEQIGSNYISGWHPFEGFVFDPVKQTLKYPEDPAYTPLAKAQLRDETIIFYQHAWVAIVQPDNSFEVARID